VSARRAGTAEPRQRRANGGIVAKGYSLHIGVNSVDPTHYAGWSGPLGACEADAEDMETIARDRGFSTHQLLTAKATRAAVIDGIKAAAGRAAAGDIFLLTYAGHGGQVPDTEDDDGEADLQDETWCLFDGELIDDELHELWSGFKPGVRVLVISDSCHSGTVTRQQYNELVASGVVRQPVTRADGSSAPVFRVMPDDVAMRTYRKNKTFYKALARDLPAKPSAVRASVRLISGCQDNQLSMDGTFNGLFTATLLRVWNDGAFQGTYRQFHRAIVKLMPPTQTPNHFTVGAADAQFDEQAPFAI
jgi:hypothetical protein